MKPNLKAVTPKQSTVGSPILLALAGSREPEIRETEPVKPPSWLTRAERGGNWSAKARTAGKAASDDAENKRNRLVYPAVCVSVCMYVDAACAIVVNYRIVYLIYDRIKDELRNLHTSIKNIPKNN